jgi:putative methyltransferase (TIGR04325 family)
MSAKATKSSLKEQVKMLARVIRGRLYHALPIDLYMKGAYPTLEAALASQPRRQLVGYDHKDVVPVNSTAMMTILSWDYPVLLWLDRVIGNTPRIVDAGGHIGVKYRAWREILAIKPDFEWIVLDLPAAVEEGRARAAADGLEMLKFESDPSKLPATDLFLASGLLQYYPNDLSILLKELPHLPTHVIVNKVNVRSGPAFFTMQKIGPSRVPYQIRNRQQFEADMTGLGYEVVDQWENPTLAHLIRTHPELGKSASLGYYFRLKK